MQCPACSSARVTPPCPYTSFETHFKISAWETGFAKDVKATPELVRVCGDCGHVFFFLGPKDLEKVRAAMKG